MSEPASPLPWFVRSESRTRHHIAIGAPGDGRKPNVAVCKFSMSDHANAVRTLSAARADAEFIVRACNAHYVQLAALKAIVDDADTFDIPNHVLATLRATVLKAEGRD